MTRTLRPFTLGILLLAVAPWSHAQSVSFTPHELFHIPFGDEREALGAHIEGGNLLIPRDFTMDGAGHYYIYDSNHHRIARFSSEGKYEMGYRYPTTAKQIFAHADSHQNLWLLVSDPERGLYYGVYGSDGHALRQGVFSQFDHFRLHPDDDAVLHVILSSEKKPGPAPVYLFDEDSLLMKKETIARPPESHHQVRQGSSVFFIDAIPGRAEKNSAPVNRITDSAHHGLGDIQGAVIYMTDQGDIYTRVSDRDIRVYDLRGALKGKVTLSGLASACAAIRFDSEGNLYELDGIPDADNHYSAKMPGMRLIRWERH
jgi:hypothetical protein